MPKRMKYVGTWTITITKHIEYVGTWTTKISKRIEYVGPGLIQYPNV